MLRVLILSLLFLTYCEALQVADKPEESTEAEVQSVLTDVVEYTNNESKNEQQRERLRNNEQIIYSTVSDRFGSSTGSGYGSYDTSDKCDDDDRCKDICDKTTRNKGRCYREPRELVEDIQTGLFDIINISEVEEINVNPALLKGIIKIDKELIIKVIEKEMNIGDLKSFLAWVAINRSIASVLEREDKKGEIIETALDELGRQQSRSRKHTRTGLNIGLINPDETFLSIASSESNEYAFKIGYELIQDECRNNLPCKLKMLCARETRRSSRASSLNIRSVCNTQENPRQRSRKERVCYVHGGDVWSFLDELLIDGEIKDRNFNADYDEDDKEKAGVLKGRLTTERCNDTCGKKTSKTCPTVI